MASEPVFITTNDFGPYRYRNNSIDRGGQYITFCYVGQIPADAVRPTHPHHLIPSQHMFLKFHAVCCVTSKNCAF
jgi:hypothetical protein